MMLRPASPPLLLFILAVLTLLFDFATSSDTPVKLIAETCAWPILFLTTTIIVSFQVRQQNLETLSVDDFQWIEKNEAKVAIYFLCAHICSVAATGHPLWSNILLPAAVASTKLVSSVASHRPPAPIVIIVTCLAAILSLHCATMLSNPPVTTMILEVGRVVFLSIGLLLCETVNTKSLPRYKESSKFTPSSTSGLFPFPQQATFFVRLRTIAFLLTILLITNLFALCRLNLFEKTLTEDWWKSELTLIGIEWGRWFLICYLLMEQLYDSSVVAIALAVSSLIQLIYQFPTQYLLAAETSIAIVLLSPNLITDHLSSSIRVNRITFRYLLVVIVAVAIALTSLWHISAPMMTNEHPIEELIRTSRARFSELVAKQSRTLEEAVSEYKSRTGMHPPPNFDQWYAFAKSNNVQNIDEYDVIQDVIRPFWGIPPATIRRYVRDALGEEPKWYTGIFIRDGRVNITNPAVNNVEMVGLLQKIAHHLPDMDLLFNPVAEPSVVVPHDMLDQLVETARKRHRPKATRNFSTPPSDLVDIDNIPTHYGTNVLNIGAQLSWNVITQSCPLDSPARELNGTDLTTSYARFPLGFIYNKTAFSEVCNQPSLPYHHGFFDRPCSLLYSSTLLPVFSYAKVSTFNDILYPYSIYYSDKHFTNESKDMDWELKQDQLHWRGTSTCGFATVGGWNRHIRHRMVMAMNNIKNPVKILKKVDNTWIEGVMPPAAAQKLFDVKFTKLDDCGTAEAMIEEEKEFSRAPHEDFQDLWKSKYLLDIDGHAHSQRFYALLKSKSLVFKCTMFREWHDEWVWPWVHYIPLGLNGLDWFETVRFFAQEETGRLEAKRIADESRQWSNKVLRKADMEAWMFRLLLEYARVVDDQRELLGFQLYP